MYVIYKLNFRIKKNCKKVNFYFNFLKKIYKFKISIKRQF